MVQDGAEGSILVAQDVPAAQVAYYYDYARGHGYVAAGVAWQRVGTALAVRPVILPGNQIRLTLTPVISYDTAGSGGRMEIPGPARPDHGLLRHRLAGGESRSAEHHRQPQAEPSSPHPGHVAFPSRPGLPAPCDV